MTPAGEGECQPFVGRAASLPVFQLPTVHECRKDERSSSPHEACNPSPN